jgi:hypothetical protein
MKHPFADFKNENLFLTFCDDIMKEDYNLAITDYFSGVI